jgi:hypothetical protein
MNYDTQDEQYERGEEFLTQEVLDAREELGWDDEPLPIASYFKGAK